MTFPARHANWPALAALADRLHAAATDEADRAAFATVAAIWRAVVARAPLPTRVTATRAQIRAAIAGARAGATDAADADLLAALAFHHDPVPGSTSDCAHILSVALINAAIREAAPARRAAASAPVPVPLPTRVAPKQPALFG